MPFLGSQGDLFEAQLLQAINETAVPVPAAQTGNQQIKLGFGRLARILVTSVGTVAMTFYDNAANAASGTVIGVIPSGAAVGTTIQIGFVCQFGIVAGGNAGNPAVTVGVM